MSDVGKQTKTIKKMPCPKCRCLDTVFRLPRDTSQKESKLICNCCKHEELFP